LCQQDPKMKTLQTSTENIFKSKRTSMDKKKIGEGLNHKNTLERK